MLRAATEGSNLSADDVIFAGSPGVKAGSAEEMDVPKGHVWNQEAEGDTVPDVGRFGHGGSQWRLGGGTFITPSDELFGATQMNTRPEGHSEYWNRGTTALRNQALVVVGKYGYVTAPEWHPCPDLVADNRSVTTSRRTAGLACFTYSFRLLAGIAWAGPPWHSY